MIIVLLICKIVYNYICEWCLLLYGMLEHIGQLEGNKYT